MKKLIWILSMAVFVAAAGTAAAQQADVKLKEVVVTATKTEKDPKDVTQSVTVLTGEEIRKAGAVSVAEAVRSATGVAVSDQGSIGSLTTVNIRGANYSQVLVLLDGVRLNSPRDGGVDLSAIPVNLDEVDRIEIVRGPGSPLYGADAMGGVVNIITKRPGTVTVNRISGAIGSHGYDTVQVGTSGRQGATLFSMSAERETSDGYRTNSDLEQWTVGGRLGYDIGKTASLDLSANYISKDNGAPGSTAFASPSARQEERQTVAGVSYRQRMNKELDLKLSASDAEGTLQYHEPASAFGPVSSRHESSARTGEAQATWVAAPWSMFTLGYELRKNRLESTDSGQHSASNHAWYLQDEIPAGDSFLFVIGERFDSHSVYGDQWSSRASGRYQRRGSGMIIRLSYGESFRSPTFNDLYWTDPFGNRGNQDLKPEKAKEYEVGVEQPFSGGSALKAAYFERKIKDMINWQEYAPFQYEPVNIGKAEIKGLDAEADLKLSGTSRFTLNYTYMKPVDEVTGMRIYSTVIPKQQMKGSLTMAVDANVYVTASGRAVENYVQHGSPEWKYSVYDAKIAQKFGRTGGVNAELYFAMTNIFDRKYENIQGYPMPPREIRGGVTVQY